MRRPPEFSRWGLEQKSSIYGVARKGNPSADFIGADAQMIATIAHIRILWSSGSAQSSASFCKLSGQTKENCVPPRTDSNEVILFGSKIGCLLAHDHVLLRQGLRRLLEDEPDIEVVGEAGNAAECLRRVFELRPDVVIADADTFGLSAVDSEIVLARESPQTKAVFLNLQEQNGSTTG